MLFLIAFLWGFTSLPEGIMDLLCSLVMQVMHGHGRKSLLPRWQGVTNAVHPENGIPN